MATVNSKRSGATLEVSKNDVKLRKSDWQDFPAGSKVFNKTMNRLARSEIEKFRSQLLAKRREILGTVTGIETEVSIAGGNDTGPMDIADMAAFSRAVEDDYRLLESEKRVLDDIDEALQRIQEGTYGLCQECMEQIPHRRLQVIPWARYCVTCENKIEASNQTGNGKEKRNWAEKHAYGLQRLFEQWQKPLGIDSKDYYEHTMKDLLDYYDDPLRKSLIESIC